MKKKKKNSRCLKIKCKIRNYRNLCNKKIFLTMRKIINYIQVKIQEVDKIMKYLDCHSYGETEHFK